MSSFYDDLLHRLGQPAPWSDDNETALLEPYQYITSVPGKEIRTKLIEAFNVWLQVPQDRLDIIARIVRMLHTASLIMDDVEDDSQLRRGVPVAHKIYGIPQAINSANYVYFLAYQEIFKLRDQLKSENGGNVPDIDALINEELLSLHRGQGLELLWRDSLTCPTEEEYIGMVNNKTGGLIRIGVKLMMAHSQNSTDLVPLANLIGVHFQIRDDYMNLQSTKYTDNKGFCEDLTEGKFSFPIVHSIRANTSNRQVLNVLQKRPTTPTMKQYVVNYMRETTNSFAYTRGVLQNLESQARAEIARLGGNQKLSEIIDLLHVEPEDDS
ncbi:terpenoid synthase [Exidia glandulosa HHB12029]|uniref:(2E,6E)-farnesyl diphosphate synthase n=1 Tax=Exidia glandulosa HHB12029 TaxID=1314781 RepID=A0A165M7L3_EXIGL|nr:terpenoid synthase [Exidia glandulosa HHB12029]